MKTGCGTNGSICGTNHNAGCGEGLVLDISALTSEGEDGDTDTELRRAVGRVPGAARLELVATRCRDNRVVRH